MSTFENCREFKDVYEQIHGAPMRWDILAERIAEVEEAFFIQLNLNDHHSCQAKWIVKVAERLHQDFADGGSNTLPYETPVHPRTGKTKDYVGVLTEEDIIWAVILSCTSEYVRLRKIAKGEPFDLFLNDRNSREVAMQCMFNPFFRLFMQKSSGDELPTWSTIITEEEKEYFKTAYLETLPIFLGEQAAQALAAETNARKRKEEQRRNSEPPYKRYVTRN